MCVRNMDVKINFGEFSDGKEEHTNGNWQKDDPCYKVAKYWVELFSRKTERASDETGYLAEVLNKVLKDWLGSS